MQDWDAVAAAVLAGAVLLVGVPRFAARRPGYSHTRQTISELGEAGARDAGRVGALLFAPVGALLLAAAALNGLAEPSSRPALAVATGYLIAAAFPCDPGSPLSGSVRQHFHNLGGAVEYVGGGLDLLVLGDAPLLRSTGVVALITAGLLSTPVAARVRGAVQRAGEAALFIGVTSALATS